MLNEMQDKAKENFIGKFNLESNDIKADVFIFKSEYDLQYSEVYFRLIINGESHIFRKDFDLGEGCEIKSRYINDIHALKNGFKFGGLFDFFYKKVAEIIADNLAENIDDMIASNFKAH